MDCNFDLWLELDGPMEMSVEIWYLCRKVGYILVDQLSRTIWVTANALLHYHCGHRCMPPYAFARKLH